MVTRTRSSNLQLPALADSLERLTYRAVAPFSPSRENDRPTGREHNTLDGRGQMPDFCGRHWIGSTLIRIV